MSKDGMPPERAPAESRGGLVCTGCGGTKWKTFRTRDIRTPSTIMRKRQCRACGKKIVTHEMLVG